ADDLAVLDEGPPFAGPNPLAGIDAAVTVRVLRHDVAGGLHPGAREEGRAARSLRGGLNRPVVRDVDASPVGIPDPAGADLEVGTELHLRRLMPGEAGPRQRLELVR